jgi:hypothetical protein
LGSLSITVSKPKIEDLTIDNPIVRMETKSGIIHHYFIPWFSASMLAESTLLTGTV